LSHTEDDLIAISSLQHWVFCPRQCALIHLEQAWAENLYTAEGKNLHERVHQEETESRRDIVTVRGLRLVSRVHGITGQADVVDFIRSDSGSVLEGRTGYWQPFPVEYKRGRAKPDSCDEVQLCAQALCLEEMLCVRIDAGALFYGQPRRRHDVSFDQRLREETIAVVNAVREMMSCGKVPQAQYLKSKCESCSLVEICLPKTLSRKTTVQEYMKHSLTLILRDES
jgi:CRISPR-associated exonuclease Cas4